MTDPGDIANLQRRLSEIGASRNEEPAADAPAGIGQPPGPWTYWVLVRREHGGALLRGLIERAFGSPSGWRSTLGRLRPFRTFFGDTAVHGAPVP